MGRLIQGAHRSDVKLWKLKSSYMWNSVYYRRRTKFVVYQLATTFIGIGGALSNVTIADYNSQKNHQFPEATIDNSALIGSLAFNVFACGSIGLVFTNALFFDLFWPERIEAAALQWIWKSSALFVAMSQLAASIATTIIVSTRRAGVSGVPPGEELAFEQAWTSKPLVYRKDTTLIICIVFCWIGGISTLYSTFVMWDCYAHNNKHGPLADRGNVKQNLRPAEGTNSSVLEMRRDTRGG